MQYGCWFTWDCALTLAPFVTKTFTTSACPANDAICNAVFPFCKMKSKTHQLSHHSLSVLTIYKISNLSVLNSPRRTKLTSISWETSPDSYQGLNPHWIWQVVKSIKCVILTLVAASTLASRCSSSETTSTWPSLEARCSAFKPFWLKVKGKRYSAGWKQSRKQSTKISEDNIPPAITCLCAV